MHRWKEIFQLIRLKGKQDYIGEPVSQIEHMQQAAYFAQVSQARVPLILGAFFHDIGHLCAPDTAAQMDGLGVLRHEVIGADYLRERGLRGDVADLVELHVQAKRYLCFAQKGYYERLSSASRGTLNFQGGKMDETDARRFEAHPLFRDVLRLRVWDEKAKIVDGPVVSLSKLESWTEEYYEENQAWD
ncbi:MAG: HD domain-containing protein [Myxococcota bacterium]|nr:HD domain-containing protein [Myxococcota bacterium]